MARRQGGADGSFSARQRAAGRGAGLSLGREYRLGRIDQVPQDRRANYVVVRLRVEANAVERVRTDSVAKIESLGLLGDKFLLLTAGSPNAPSVEAGALIKSQDPVNYAALLQARGTGDLVANVIAISNWIRQFLDSANEGHGILAELIKGPSNPQEKTLTLASMRETLDSLPKLTARLEVAVDRVNRGQGVIGAMLSPQNNGQRVVENISSASESMRTASARLDQTSLHLHDLVARINTANGCCPQLTEDQRYAGRVMSNLRRSSGRHARGARQDQQQARHARAVDQRSVALRQNY